MQSKLLSILSLALFLQLVHFSECQVSANSVTVSQALNGSQINGVIPWNTTCSSEQAGVGSLSINTCTNPCKVELDRVNRASFKLTPYQTYAYFRAILKTNGQTILDQSLNQRLEAGSAVDMSFEFKFFRSRSNTQAVINQDMTFTVLGNGTTNLVCRRFQVGVNGGGILSVSVLLLAIQQAYLFFR